MSAQPREMTPDHNHKASYEKDLAAKPSKATLTLQARTRDRDEAIRMKEFLRIERGKEA